MRAPWPYGDPVEKTDRMSKPTWVCPGGTCECHPAVDNEDDVVEHGVVLFDAEAMRMPGARYRAWQAGRLINRDDPYADGAGAVILKLKEETSAVLLEWAPFDMPTHPMLPFRATYHLELGEGPEVQTARRLHNIGFCFSPALEENVKAFQRVYGPPNVPVTGRHADIEAQLRAYHDTSSLPPLASPYAVQPPMATDIPRGSARESLITTPFEIGVEVGEHVPWEETDDLVIVASDGEQVLRQPLSTGRSESGLRVIAFSRLSEDHTLYGQGSVRRLRLHDVRGARHL